MDTNMMVKSHLRNEETGERISAQVVVVSDFDMPFMSIVFLMLKIAIAAIPAAFLLLVAAHFIGMIVGGFSGGPYSGF